MSKKLNVVLVISYMDMEYTNNNIENSFMHWHVVIEKLSNTEPQK